MEKRTKIKTRSAQHPRRRATEAERTVKHLLAHGAVEIPRSQWNKEPYKSWMRGIKQNGKLMCD